MGYINGGNMGDHRPWPRATSIATVIPWRDGGDPDRRTNYAHVVGYYEALDLGPVIVADDGNTAGPFNRSAAYNRGLAQTTADVILWNEADTLIPLDQILTAAWLAEQGPGLVVPYTERHELDPAQTIRVHEDGVDPFTLTGAIVYPDGASIGQAGVTSRATMDLIGGRWDEGFKGWGYDDNAMIYIFDTLAGYTRWVEGKGVHLYHLPCFVSPSPEQSEATAANAQRFHDIRQLTGPDLHAYLNSGK